MSEFTASAAIPTDLIQEFIELLTNKGSFDKWKAIKLGLKVAQWLADTFSTSNIALASKVPEGRVTNKKVADALKAIVSTEPVAKSAIAAWLLPVIIKLIIKWMTK
jgi:hypothetical protein